MSWTSHPPLHYEDGSYGQKDVEFIRFLELPDRVDPIPLLVALGGARHVNWETYNGGIHTALAERADRNWTPAELVAHAGWRVADANRTCADLDGYRAFIRASRAEW